MPLPDRFTHWLQHADEDLDYPEAEPDVTLETLPEVVDHLREEYEHWPEDD